MIVTSFMAKARDDAENTDFRAFFKIQALGLTNPQPLTGWATKKNRSPGCLKSKIIQMKLA
jgi:hypothetical protein